MIILSDQETFAQIYNKYFPRLVVFAGSFTETPEDTVQDVFVKLYNSDNTFENESLLSSFLYTAVRNRSIDLLRARQRKDGLLEQIEQEYTDDHLLNDQLDGDLLYLLAQSLEDLPPQSRRVIHLLFENDLSYKDAAAALDISPNTVKNMRKFALDLLRRKFAGKKLMSILLASQNFLKFH
jgi:RNA polymerase sigma-70 factor (ECF subfamily)